MVADLTIDDVIDLVDFHEPRLHDIARKAKIDFVGYKSRILLEAPGYIKDNQLPSPEEFFSLAGLVKDDLVVKQHPYSAWFDHGAENLTVDDLEFRELPEDIAKIFHTNFHYVGSFRPGRHWALFNKDTDKVVCMGSVSDYDQPEILEYLEHVVKDNTIPFYVKNAARFFAFEGAPKNCFSHFWGKIRELLAREGDDFLMSTINPNLGFEGESHDAAQFEVIALEKGALNIYVREGGRIRYYTFRELLKKFGTANPEILKRDFPDEVIVSSIPMHPLRHLGKPLIGGLLDIPPEPLIINRPANLGTKKVSQEVVQREQALAVMGSQLLEAPRGGPHPDLLRFIRCGIWPQRLRAMRVAQFRQSRLSFIALRNPARS